MTIEFLQYITVSMAAVGAVLGVINTWNALDKQRVKLVVRPAPGLATPTGQRLVVVEVLNLSSFAVTISEMGLNRRDGKRHITGDRPLMNDRPLPQRLEAREAISAYFPLSEIDLKLVTNAFAKTSCGEIEVGDSPGWKQIRASD
jgi:hypothetical protein